MFYCLLLEGSDNLSASSGILHWKVLTCVLNSASFQSMIKVFSYNKYYFLKFS